MRDIDPIELASSVQKSEGYFRHARWRGKRVCPRCEYRYLYYFADRYCCKRCRYKFGEFTGTYLGKLKVPLNTTAHLLYLFALGVPAYRMRFYVPVSLRTIERTFRIFREAIYGSSLDELRVEAVWKAGNGRGVISAVTDTESVDGEPKGRHSYSAYTRETAEL